MEVTPAAHQREAAKRRYSQVLTEASEALGTRRLAIGLLGEAAARAPGGVVPFQSGKPAGKPSSPKRD